MIDEKDLPEEALDERFGWREHAQHSPEHSGIDGHYCLSWDGLWICADCGEFEACTCFDKNAA